MVRLGKVSIAVKTFGHCDFSRLAVTNWRLRRWRLWFLALMTATPYYNTKNGINYNKQIQIVDFLRDLIAYSRFEHSNRNEF